VKFIEQCIHNWRSGAMALALAGSAFAQTTPPPTPPAAAAPAAPAAPAIAQDAESARDAARAKRERDRETVREKQAEARAKAAEDRARTRASTPRVYVFGQGAYLGVDVQDVTKDRLPALKLKEERGAEVTMVDQDGPAGKAGLKEGDVILSFNGEKVESAETLKRMIHETPSGRSVALGISRNGQSQNVNAMLGDRKDLARSGVYVPAGPGPRIVIPPMPPMHVEIPQIEMFSRSSTPRVGVSVESLTPQLGDFFGAPNGQGLLVRSVEKGSPADQAGIKAGDVIVKVGGERIGDSGDWRMTMRDKSGSVAFTIMRDKREQTVNVKLPERRSANNGVYFDFDAPKFALDMKDFEKNMKEWQKDFEKNSKEWQKDWEKNAKEWEKFKYDFRFDNDDDGRTIIITPKTKDKSDKTIEKQMMKSPPATIVLKEKATA
jgi:C-terminal processing protease CtpA/Prc